METIVVGLDGSPSSEHALRWALEHASEVDLVRAIYVWHVFEGANPTMTPVTELKRLRPDADKYVAGIVDRVVDNVSGPLPSIERVSYYGHPGQWLVKLSAEADLIVVGSRGLGGFKGLLLGSVSTYVAHHSTCPVVIVPSLPAEPT